MIYVQERTENRGEEQRTEVKLQSLSVNFGPPKEPSQLHRILIDGDSHIYFELSENIVNTFCLFKQNSKQWLIELTWMFDS